MTPLRRTRPTSGPEFPDLSTLTDSRLADSRPDAPCLDTSPLDASRLDTPSPRATLLLFTLGAVAETERRHLLPSTCRAEELALHRACIENVLSAGRQVGCRLVVSSPSDLDLAPDALLVEQSGQNFGQRLGQAIEVACDHARPVVAVGSDSPDFRAKHISDALEMLDETAADVVLGPCHDGGLYLLALRRPLVGLLETTRWCRSNTLVDLVRRLETQGLRVELLAPLSDLDKPSDLEQWMASPAPCALGSHLFVLISKALASHRRPAIAPGLKILPASYVGDCWGRAPPRAA